MADVDNLDDVEIPKAAAQSQPAAPAGIDNLDDVEMPKSTSSTAQPNPYVTAEGFTPARTPGPRGEMPGWMRASAGVSKAIIEPADAASGMLGDVRDGRYVDAAGKGAMLGASLFPVGRAVLGAAGLAHSLGGIAGGLSAGSAGIDPEQIAKDSTGALMSGGMLKESVGPQNSASWNNAADTASALSEHMPKGGGGILPWLISPKVGASRIAMGMARPTLRTIGDLIRPAPSAGTAPMMSAAESAPLPALSPLSAAPDALPLRGQLPTEPPPSPPLSLLSSARGMASPPPPMQVAPLMEGAPAGPLPPADLAQVREQLLSPPSPMVNRPTPPLARMGQPLPPEPEAFNQPWPDTTPGLGGLQPRAAPSTLRTLPPEPAAFNQPPPPEFSRQPSAPLPRPAPREAEPEAFARPSGPHGSASSTAPEPAAPSGMPPIDKSIADQLPGVMEKLSPDNAKKLSAILGSNPAGRIEPGATPAAPAPPTPMSREQFIDMIDALGRRGGGDQAAAGGAPMESQSKYTKLVQKYLDGTLSDFQLQSKLAPLHASGKGYSDIPWRTRDISNSTGQPVPGYNLPRWLHGPKQ